jgi:hypothetical protein
MSQGAANMGLLFSKLTEQGAANFADVLNEMGEKGAANFGGALGRMGTAQIDAVAKLLNDATPDGIKLLAIALGMPGLKDVARPDPPGCARMLGWAGAVLGGIWLVLMIIMFFSPPSEGSTLASHRQAALFGGTACGLLPCAIGVLLLLKAGR